MRFQQIQKYECGANRISAARLWRMAEALEVPVGYFYDGLAEGQRCDANGERADGGEVLARKETLDLVRAYYQLGERPRRRLLDLAKSLNGDSRGRLNAFAQARPSGLSLGHGPHALRLRPPRRRSTPS